LDVSTDTSEIWPNRPYFELKKLRTPAAIMASFEPRRKSLIPVVITSL
jgi:hypothetical protein